MAHPTPDQRHSALLGSTVYAEFLAERDEILRHKWLLSENAGRDVGFEQALIDWVRHHRSEWRRRRRAAAAA
jgi:hypothetical protein